MSLKTIRTSTPARERCLRAKERTRWTPPSWTAPTLRAGAVAGVTRVRSPISAARAVMEKSPHVMIAGRGADEFAAERGAEDGGAELLLYGEPLAGAGEAAQEGRASRFRRGLRVFRRKASRFRLRSLTSQTDTRRHGTPGWWRWTGRETLRRALRQAGCRAKCRGALAIRRLSEQARMRRTSRARFRARGRASILSGSAWRARFAILCTSTAYEIAGRCG